MARGPIEIDPGKLRAAIRRLGNEYVFYMLHDAIDLLPQAKLHRIARKYLDLERLRPDSEDATKSNLLADVEAFEESSLAGEYYESFDVNSKNFMEKSKGTTGWIAECHRLLDRCVKEARIRTPRSTDLAEVCWAFDIIFGLLDRIDNCPDDIIFFADEAGAWQVGVDWDRVLPLWFRVLSATVSPEEYAKRITTLLGHHYDPGRDKMLSTARKVGTIEQRKVLAEVADQQVGRLRKRAEL